MADRTMAAMFDRYQDAAEAVRRLEAAGVTRSDISIVSNDESHAKHHGDGTEPHGTGLGAGASLGTLIGAGQACWPAAACRRSRASARSWRPDGWPPSSWARASARRPAGSRVRSSTSA